MSHSYPRNWRPGNPHHASNSPESSPESSSGKAQRNFPVEDRKVEKLHQRRSGLRKNPSIPRNPAEKPCCDEMRRRLTSGLGQV